MRILSISIVVASLLQGAASAQTTWYVDVNGTPPGTGTALDPYTSIQYAIDQPSTAAGDTVLVAPGVYAEFLDVDTHVLIKSSSGPLATILRTSGSANAVLLRGPDPFPSSQLEGFTIERPSGSGTLVSSFNGLLRDCIVRGNGHTLGAAAQYDLAIERCVITGCTRGIFSSFAGIPYVRETISWGNQENHFFAGSIAFVDYCAGLGNLGYTEGTGNVPGDPGMWDVADGDYRLRPGSPCIDAGDPASPLDLDGSRADIGPFPYDSNYAPPPTSYCTAKSNSLACVPAIGSSGTASASGSPFVVTCTNELNQRPGLLFYGYTPQGIPFQGGWLCVKAPTKRTPIADSGGSTTGLDCTGAYAFDFDARIQSGIDPALVAGEIVYCQFWSRDGGDPTGFGSNRSDALRFGIAP